MPDVKEMGRIRVSVEEARQRQQEDGATILDVVDTVAYDRTEDQIAGAVRIAPEKVQDEFEQLPEERAVYAYCT